ncbi:MAG: T9SS type A sorting domain-containing protein [Fluviicola sp.]|nr:T9SS type A sorting domain-containing protein [Fluviicola sp.]
MKKMLLLVFALLNLLKLNAQNQPCKEVIGYYPNWQWYDRNKLVTPQSIDYTKYSIINYSFFAPQADGTIKITDPWADKNLLLGPINWAVAPAGYDSSYDFGNPAYHQPGNKFADICHQHHVKLMPSIGGWTLSDHFPAIAADATKRQTFANQCVALIQAFGFDGIDLDWEYPGFADHSGTPQDEVNFTLLLQAIRTAIDNYGTSINKDMYLTIAVSADPTKMDDVEWSNVSQIVDKINLMSYDFFGAFDSFTNHNSPLFAPTQGNAAFNAHAAVESLVNTYHISRDQINLGLAFYGRSQKTNSSPALFVPSTGTADQVTFQVDEGTPMYYNYVLQQNLFDEYWDDVAKVPYALGKNGLNTFLSFDNERSIAEKAKYVIDHDLSGVIIWEITGDYIETAPGSGVIGSTPLADTLNAVLCHYTGETTAALDEQQLNVSIYPNPSEDHLTITSSKAIQHLVITQVSGELVEKIDCKQEFIYKLSTNQLKSGVYLIVLTTQDGQFIQRFIKK